jgi:hypothetical protein
VTVSYEISLEIAYGQFLSGKISGEEAYKLALGVECECGNGGTHCWSSTHEEMRNQMIAAKYSDTSVETLITTCVNCGKQLNQLQCKLVCECGYFASCSDYY